MKEAILVALIVSLFVLGFGIALNSGGDGRLRNLANTLSAMLVRFACYAVGLFAIQKAIGAPWMLGW